MNILITGATGFVMSNLARRILEDRQDVRLVLLDINPVERLVSDYFSGHRDHAEFIQADISDTGQLGEALHGRQFSHIIHAAAITHDAAAERNNPTRYIDVNLNGTVALLEWIRARPKLTRCIHVSTGGVYGNPTDLSPSKTQVETGPFDPPELYAVTKYAAELVVRRYGELFGIPQIRVRFADVFGPMERPTGARSESSMSVIYRMMRAVIERRPLAVSERTLDARIDLTSAEDIARAIVTLLFDESPLHDVYNISAGETVSMHDLFETFAQIEPSFAFEPSEARKTEVDFDPENSLARYNVYDTTRIQTMGWQPRPLVEQLASYRTWVLEEPATRCPELGGPMDGATKD